MSAGETLEYNTMKFHATQPSQDVFYPNNYKLISFDIYMGNDLEIDQR